MEKIVVTSALPYVNGVKHIGNITGSLLPADVYARYLRLQGRDVAFICGTDEHGAPTEIAALKEKMAPAEFCEKNFLLQKSIYEKWGFSFERFGRTSGKENHETTKEMFLLMKQNGFVSEKMLSMPYCLLDKMFLPDRFIEGECPNCGYGGARGDQCEKCGKVLDPDQLKNARCNLCGKKQIEFRKTKHLFLDLDKLQKKLEEWVAQQKHWPPNARNFALQWMKEGLKPRCITRDLKWGVAVPVDGYEKKVFYVWFDAPIGYISITKEWAGENGKKWEEYWKEGKVIHFLGKDNIAFHTVIWPAMLLASGYAKLPFQVRSYEFLNLEGRKFSTSRNWGINSDEAIEWLPADYWRYYLASILPEHSDSDFSLQEFQKAVNSDLNDTLGNLAHRCFTFIKNNFGGKVPTPKKELGEEDKKFVEEIGEQVAKAEAAFESYKLQEALRNAMELARAANKYFNDGQPWKKVKGNAKEKEEAGTTVFLACNCLRSLSIILSPFIPASSEKLYALTGGKSFAKEKWGNAQKIAVKAGATLPLEELKPIFAKLEDGKVEEIKAKLSERSKEK